MGQGSRQRRPFPPRLRQIRLLGPDPDLVWDHILGLKLFPDSVAKKEMAFYRKIQNKYGLPLDNRQTYTKLNWILWTATLTQDRSDFEALVDPVFRFLNETPDRSPMTDRSGTKSGKKVGFTARPVVGGVFLQTLYSPTLWKKWAGRPNQGQGLGSAARAAAGESRRPGRRYPADRLALHRPPCGRLEQARDSTRPPGNKAAAVWHPGHSGCGHRHQLEQQ